MANNKKKKTSSSSASASVAKTTTKKSNGAKNKRSKGAKTEQKSYAAFLFYAFFAALFAVLMLIGLLTDFIDPLGLWIKKIFLGVFGASGFTIPFFLGYVAVLLAKRTKHFAFRTGSSVAFIVTLSAFFNIFLYSEVPADISALTFPENFTALTSDLFTKGSQMYSGGVIGGWIELLFRSLIGKVGSGIVLGVFVVATFVFATNIIAVIRRLASPGATDEFELDTDGKARPVSVERDIRVIKKDLHRLAKQTQRAERTGKFNKDEDLILSTVRRPDDKSVSVNADDFNTDGKPSDNENKGKGAPTVAFTGSNGGTPSSAPADSEDLDSILNEISSPYTKGARNADKIRRKKHIKNKLQNEATSGDLLIPFTAKNAVNASIPTKDTNAEFIFPAAKSTQPTPETSSRRLSESFYPRTGAKDDPKAKRTPATKGITGASDSEFIRDDIIEKAVEDPKQTLRQMSMAQQPEETPTYKFPSLSLLKYVPGADANEQKEELKATAIKLRDALLSFNVATTVQDAKRGPTVTRYELAPDKGVKISKITNLSEDIALHLKASSVRIENHIPGTSAMGIEIPNKDPDTVYIKEILAGDEFQQGKSKLSVALGKDISGKSIVVDLAKMPHLLIAGSTGSGKSVCINSILMSILYKSTPDEVKLILVDPKVVELNIYNGIPHLLIPVVTEPTKAAGALQWAVQEMLQRYKLFAEKGVRDFAGYNNSLRDGEEKMPQILIVIDELADLIMASKNEVEDAICRLAQMARAAGMHLVVATQRPSADVVTGLIKSNVPSRISFAVSSQIDSRVILDCVGAEKLIGRGDMLYNPIGAPKPIRVQGCFVSDKEVEAVVDAVKSNGVAEYDDSVLQRIEQIEAQAASRNGMGDDAGGNSKEDPRIMEAIECVVEYGQASTSMLQRRLGLGYARAAKVIDQMEARGIVGPYQGSKPREVLMTKSQFIEWRARNEDI